MTSRQRIIDAIAHREPDILPVDFGGGFQTGIHVSAVYALRQALGLDPPGTPVQVVEIYQMLGQVAPDLQEVLGVDVASLAGSGTMFGYPSLQYKEWTMADGTPTLVPIDFNTDLQPDGSLLQYPGNDRSAPPSGVMPAGGHFFDAIIRQEPIDEANLRIEDNLEEFVPISEAELQRFAERARRLHDETDKAIFCTFSGLTFGDIALVPATFLKHPRGIRDITEWYMSTMTRTDHICAVFDRQADIAIENLKRLYEAVGDRITLIATNGTDFGTQNGPFCSPDQYRHLYRPYQKRVNGWIHANTPWKTFMHCCGGIEPLLDEIVEAEFDILSPVQCSATGMDPAEIKRRYGHQLTFWGGGVDTQHTLPFGTPDAVRDQVRQRIETFAPGGGYVFCSIHNIVAGCPTENLLAMFETVKEYRR